MAQSLPSVESGWRVCKSVCLSFLTCFLLTLSMPSAWSWESYDYASVKVGGGAAFLVTDTPQMDADTRAREITAEVDQILRNGDLQAKEIGVKPLNDGTWAVVLNENIIARATSNDARAFGMNEKSLAERWAVSLRVKASRMEPMFQASHKLDVKMLGEHQVLLLLLQIAILLAAAFICGEIVAHFGQPSVIGQMMAGIVLGKSVFGSIFPEFAGLIFPVETSQSNLLEVVSWIGVIFLLMLTGLETDIELIKKQGRSALGASILGIIIPFSTGFGFAFVLPEELLLNPSHRLLVALFIGTVFSVSSVPVIAKILMEMRLLRRNVAQVILATALVHDTIGTIILALVAALASAHSSFGPELLKAPVGTLIFLTVVFVFRNVFFAMLRWVNDHIESEEALITCVTVILLASAACTHAIGVHVVLGAFVVGFLLSQTPIVGKRVTKPFELITMGIFAPIFFAGAGLHVNLQLLADPKLLMITVVMSLLACASKVGANFVGGRWGGLTKWEALCLGFGANAPGAMGLIVGILGYSMGIITVEMLSVIIVMSLITTAITPPLLKWALRYVVVSDEEQVRLDQEEKKAQTHIGDIKRVLLPTSGSDSNRFRTAILKAISSEHTIEATALTVTAHSRSDTMAAATEAVVEMETLTKSDKVTLVRRRSDATDKPTGILEEARRGSYDLIVLTVYQSESEGALFEEDIDRLIAESPCPLLVIQRGEQGADWRLQNLLIPSTGADTSIRASEMGLLIAKETKAQVTCLSVLEKARAEDAPGEAERARKNADDVVGAVAELASAFEVKVETLVVEGDTAGGEIVALADSKGVDGIILGGVRRPTQDLFLGQVIHQILREAKCPVAVYIQ